MHVSPSGLSSYCVSSIGNHRCRCRLLFYCGSCIRATARRPERQRRQGRRHKRPDRVPGHAGSWSLSLHRRTRRPKKAQCQPPRSRFCSKSSSLPPILLAHGHARITRNAVGGSVQKTLYARVPTELTVRKFSGRTFAQTAVGKSGYPIRPMGTRPCPARDVYCPLTVKRSFSVWDLLFAVGSRRPPLVEVGSRGNPEPRCIPPAATTQAVRPSRLPRR
jgi:hypothetical protein